MDVLFPRLSVPRDAQMLILWESNEDRIGFARRREGSSGTLISSGYKSGIVWKLGGTDALAIRLAEVCLSNKDIG